MMEMTNPLISCGEMTVPLPDGDELWYDSSATEWVSRSLRLSHTRQSAVRCLAYSVRSTLNSSFYAPDKHSDPERKFTLYGLWRFVLECRQAQDLMKTDNDGYIDVSWITVSSESMAKVLQNLTRGPDSPNNSLTNTEIRLLREFLSMTLFVPTENLQSFAGKTGEDAALRVYPSLQEWTMTKEARQGTWHAAQVLHAAAQLPSGLLRDFYAVAVYHASLALFGYGIINAARRRQDGQLCTTPIWPCLEVHKDTTWLSCRSLLEIRRYVGLGEGKPAIGTAEDNGVYAYLEHGGKL